MDVYIIHLLCIIHNTLIVCIPSHSSKEHVAEFTTSLRNVPCSLLKYYISGKQWLDVRYDIDHVIYCSTLVGCLRYTEHGYCYLTYFRSEHG